MSGNEKPRSSGNLGQGHTPINVNTQYHNSKRLASTACRSIPEKTDLKAVRKDFRAGGPSLEYSVEGGWASSWSNAREVQ